MNTLVIARTRLAHRLTASGAGAALEAYEWSLYALLVTYFSPHFFGGSLQHSVLYGLGVFALGFVIRPVGALVLGRLADQRGRRPALMVSISLAGVATLAMALTPGRESIGAAAPALLLVWRLVLGFSFGGEQAIAQAYMYESAPEGRRILGTSVYSIFYGLGTVCANLIAAALLAAVGSAAMTAGYWRVPFAVAAVLSFVFLLARRTLPETLDRVAASETVAVLREWRTLIWPVLAVAGLTAGSLSSYYLWISAPTSYAISVLKMPDTQVLWAGVVSQLAFMVIAPAWGWLADRIGVLRWMAGASLILAVAMLPMQLLMNSATVTTYWVLMIGAAVCVATLSATLTGASAAIAPARHRVTVMALPYAVAGAIFGGTTPALKELSAPHPRLFSLYIALLLVITAATALLARPLDRSRTAE
ncbi:MHS family alpha-ketoglutarate permease-like MFS transporter [Nocardia sp. GAS34]|uniref:MFS transporter n=1 Tax=Nocardia sp. GAS34 TaxID=3156305 RepID=UPI003D213004